jgi:1-phosphatidylinositol-4-phosphate 5-kinase
MAEGMKQPKQSPVRITTVVDYAENEELDDDEDDRSNVTPTAPARTGGCFTAPSDQAMMGANRIGIELRVSDPSGANRGVVELVNYPAEFLAGTGELLTKSDFMQMIQEGVRIGVSNAAESNRMKTLKKTHLDTTTTTSVTNRPPAAGASNADAPAKKTMKYILNQYKPKNFQTIRKLNNISNDEFIKSICDSELVGGSTESSGKSGSLFWYSSDRKYIMKSISAEESALLNRICTSYLRYIGTHPHSLLCKFFGMFKIVTTVAAPSYIRGYKRPSRIRSGQVHTTRFVIMNNIFCGGEQGAEKLEKFDLKGTTEDRFVKQVSGKEVLKDINFQNRWVTLPENLAECLTRVIQEDCEFLSRHGIMDYSLIVGLKRSNTPETAAHLSEPFSGTVETDTTGGRKASSTIQEKIKTAVQKLLSPSTSALWAGTGSGPPVLRTEQPSRLPSIHENSHEEPSPVETRRNEESKSVFNRFNNATVGLDETKDNCLVYFFGIIDILQQYTIKKKIAHFMKKFTIGCCHEIDTVAPHYYKTRLVRYACSKVHPVDEDDIEACLDKLILPSSSSS